MIDYLCLGYADSLNEAGVLTSRPLVQLNMGLGYYPTCSVLKRLVGCLNASALGSGRTDTNTHPESRHAATEMGLDMLKGVPPTSPPHKNFHCFCYILVWIAVAIDNPLGQHLCWSFFACNIWLLIEG